MFMLEKIKSDFDRCGINPIIKKVDFTDYKKVDKINGLYAIWQGDVCVYVGQGSGNDGVRARVKHHHNKAYGIFESSTGKKNGTKDCTAWQFHRETSVWTPESWTIEFFECTSAVHRTYLEGVMMLVFNPMCNDENFSDSQ